MIQTRDELPATSDEQLGAFLQALFGSDDLIEFRYIRPGDPKTHQDWVRVCEHGNLWNVSQERNADGYGVYVGANPRKRKAGTSMDVRLARCLCVDFDTTLRLEALHQRCGDASLPAPTAIVGTGGGFHFWWRLGEPLTDLTQYTRLQKGLIAAVQSDPTIHDAARIMRVPGFHNTKPERNGVLVELIEVKPERVYPLEEFPPAEDIPRDNGRPQSVRQNGRILSGGRNNHLTSLAGTMRCRGMIVESIEAALISENTARCDPPLPDREVQSIARSVGQYAPKPDQTPQDRGDEQIAYCSHVIAKRLADVEPEEVEWLWPGRIPLGKLCLLFGDPGVGKSFLSLDIAARLSKGIPWPDLLATPLEPGNIIILSAEDGLADTIRARLDAARADVNRITGIIGVKRTAEGEPGYFALDGDLRALEEHVIENKARLVIIDPISAYLGDHDGHSNSDVRGLLGPLVDMAGRNNCAVLAVTHMNKGAAGKAIYRAMGSVAFIAAARTAWFLGRDENDPKRRLMLPAKSNLIGAPRGIAFEIVDGALAWDSTPVDVNADQLLSANPSERNARAEAESWLRELLSPGPMASTEIRKAAEAECHSWRTLVRAKANVGIRATRKGYGGKGGWMWELKAE